MIVIPEALLYCVHARAQMIFLEMILRRSCVPTLLQSDELWLRRRVRRKSIYLESIIFPVLMKTASIRVWAMCSQVQRGDRGFIAAIVSGEKIARARARAVMHQ